MIIADPTAERVCDECEIYETLLPLSGAHVLELGCGKAEKTRAIAKKVNTILALEVDQIQHGKNVQASDLPNVSFELGGAQDIPAEDASFDLVFMFKSLHHVPMEQMDAALDEIRRVLKPGGLAYISEPVFAGEFNEILRLFHDEQRVREAAFAAVKRAVQAGRFELAGQHFFGTPSHFESFEQFEDRILKVTHTHHQLAPELYQQVKDRFMQHVTPEGAKFVMPIRVDLLRKV